MNTTIITVRACNIIIQAHVHAHAHIFNNFFIKDFTRIIIHLYYVRDTSIIYTILVLVFRDIDR